MLKIFLGNMGGVIYHPPTYFDNQYEDEWITDPLTKEMVKDVDQSEVISSRLIDSPVLGPVSVKELSGGVKTLILLAFDKNQKIFNISVCEVDSGNWEKERPHGQSSSCHEFWRRKIRDRNTEHG